MHILYFFCLIDASQSPEFEQKLQLESEPEVLLEVQPELELEPNNEPELGQSTPKQDVDSDTEIVSIIDVQSIGTQTGKAKTCSYWGRILTKSSSKSYKTNRAGVFTYD